MPKLHNKKHLLGAFDIWVDSGDFFPNFPIILTKNGGWDRIIDRPVEREQQSKWLKDKKILEHMTAWLDGRPFVSVQGNHDFISLVDELHAFGYKNAHEITPEGFELEGLKWAGFPNINYMQNEWNHETAPCEFDRMIERIHESQPDLLIMHSPIRGVLDKGGCYLESIGIGHMTNYLSYRPNKVKYMFFGHCHEAGGKKKIHEDLKITFINGARHCILHDI